MKKYVVALDLHGTLLDEKWEIPSRLQKELINLLNDLSPVVEFYICTGNDYSFVEKHIPGEVIKLIDGFILETGCIVYSNGVKEYRTPEKTRKEAEALKHYLSKKNYPFVKYFGERESTITLFTADENGGEAPERFYDIINSDLLSHKYGKNFYITWSNVAFDIIPNKFSKWDTLYKISQNRLIFSFLDSYNDSGIARYSDFTFLPKNSSDKLLFYLRKNNKLIFRLKSFHLFKNQCYISDKSFTEAVIEGLDYLKKELFLGVEK